MDNSTHSDQRLIQIVDAALQDVARRSGDHLACRPGCAQCCTGSFAINALDVQRLRQGFRHLEQTDPSRAADLKTRIVSSIANCAASFPGDPESGVLGQTHGQKAMFAEFQNDEVCPVLDKVTQTCDLYAYRPMTCRVFGPPVRSEAFAAEGPIVQGIAVCELCFVDATEEEIAACEMVPDPDCIEQALLQELEQAANAASPSGETTVSFAFARWWNQS